MSSEARNNNLDFLHPACRGAVKNVLADLKAAQHDFEIFEAFRSPQRQRYLYAKGRTTAGPKVTNAKAWSSYHQYGLAADFVLKVDGAWSWKTGGKYAAAWRDLHAIGRRHGLEPLSWEMPHLQLANLKIEDLRQGLFPPGGDDAWADNLEAAIAGWDSGGAPAKAPMVTARPALPESAFEEEPGGAGATGGTSVAEAQGEGEYEFSRAGVPEAETGGNMQQGQFARIQAYIDKWEGGYVDHPEDPGGATNMGITLATLARWRGRPVSKEDVKGLTRVEQRQIMKAFYYDLVRGDDLPPAIAAVVYNGAVLHGPGRSARMLQQALRECGQPISVDGAIGKETLGAVARSDVSALLESFLSIEEQFFRSLKHFKTFGKGWLNRLEDIATFARSLLRSEHMVSDSGDERLPAPPIFEADIKRKEIPNGEVVLPDGQEPLTKVNAALGETIGRVLNGRKTALGIFGTIAAVLLPEIAPALGFTFDAQTIRDIALPLTTGMTGWGVLGKLEKWAAMATGAVGSPGKR